MKINGTIISDIIFTGSIYCLYSALTEKGNKKRTVLLPEDAIEIIKNYIIVYEKKPEDRLFIFYKVGDKHEERRDQGHAMWEFFQKCCMKYIQKKVHPHMFRHTRACKLVNDNVPIEVIQKYLGHTSISTSLIYAKVSNKHALDVIKEKSNN